MEGQKLWALIVIGVGSIISTLVIALGARRLMRVEKKGKRFIQVRRPDIIYKICACTMLHLIFERPFCIAYQMEIVPRTSGTTIIYNLLPMMPCILFLGTLRVWYFYCDKCTSFTEDAKIFTQLGNSSKKEKLGRQSFEGLGQRNSTTWESSGAGHGQSLGSTKAGEKAVRILLFIPFLLYVLIYFGLLVVMAGENQVLTNHISYGCTAPPIIVFMILLCKIPSSACPFHLKSEFISCGATLILMAIFGAISPLFTESENIGFLIRSLIVMVGLTFLCLLQTTIFPIWLDRNSHEDETNPCPLRNDSIRRSMLSMLHSQKGFRHFQNYLCKEFAQENILFFVEILKFKKIMQESLGLECKKQTLKVIPESDFETLNTDWIKVPKDVQDFFYRMYALHIFQKYCTKLSTTFVHLPEDIKQRIEGNLDDADGVELLQLFQEAQTEIWQVLQDAFRRYKTTQQYKGFKELSRTFNVLPSCPEEVATRQSLAEKFEILSKPASLSCSRLSSEETQRNSSIESTRRLKSKSKDVKSGLNKKDVRSFIRRKMEDSVTR